MAELMDYKCPACSGALEFDPATQKMLCPFCGSSFEMAQLQAKDVQMQQSQMQQPQSQQWQSAQADEWNDGNVAVYRCESCGGEIVGDETTAATACPFCGNPVVMAGRVSGEFKPEYVLPFQLEKKAATEKLKQYLSKKKFAPNAFLRENRIQEIRGLYVPVWLYDSEIHATASFEATRKRTWTQGNTEYTETSYFDVYREGDMAFANVPVDGSTKMPEDLLESVEPFDFAKAVPFQTAYLAGYLADKYDISMEQGAARVNERIQKSAEDTLRKTVQNFDSVDSRSTQMQLLRGVAKYALYPVWILNTVYRGETYTFAMNGQSGKFVGNVPVDSGKLGGLFAGVAVGAAAVLFVLGKLFGMI
jgi:DNA-directed RNA polymerase subunit RPC12/RpoP